MEIGAKNLNEELVDVNNLWKWPSEYAPYEGANPSGLVRPVFWKWKKRVAETGYLDVNGDHKVCGTFTSDSMTTWNAGRYSLGCFIDLQPGTYRFSCDSFPLESAVHFMEYRSFGDGTYMYSKVTTVIFTGHCETEFTVPSDAVILLKLCPAAITEEYTTFTNIVIKEGIV